MASPEKGAHMAEESDFKLQRQESLTATTKMTFEGLLKQLKRGEQYKNWFISYFTVSDYLLLS